MKTNPARPDTRSPNPRALQPALGFVGILGAAVAMGSMTPTARYVMDRGVSFLDLNAARSWVATILLGALLLLTGRGRLKPSTVRRDPLLTTAGLVVAFGVLLGTTNAVSGYAISQLPVGIAVVIGYTAPALVVSWEWVVRRRRPSRGIILGLVLALVGIALLSGFFHSITTGRTTLPPLGLAAAILSAFCFMGLLLTGERLTRSLGANRAVFLGYAVAAILWILLELFRGWPRALADAAVFPGVLYVSIIGTAGYLLLSWGLRYIDARIVGIVSTLEPVVAAVVSYLWLGQTLGPAQIVGGCMVLAAGAIVVGTLGTPERVAEPT